MRSEDRDPRNFTLAQWQQAKRAARDPQEIKASLQESWSISDTRNAFAAALHERGFVLAKGDRRGFVAVDLIGEVYAIPKWIDKKAKEVRSALGAHEDLPSIQQAKEQWEQTLRKRIEELRSTHINAVKARYAALRESKSVLKAEHKSARQSLVQEQTTRQAVEQKELQAKFRKGLLGIFDRLSGKHKRLRRENEETRSVSMARDQRERDVLSHEQRQVVVALQKRASRLSEFSREQRHELRTSLRELKPHFERQDLDRSRRSITPSRSR